MPDGWSGFDTVEDMKVIYISGPYRAPTNGLLAMNIVYAKRAAIELWEMGYAVLTPHLNTAWFNENTGVDYIAGDLEFIKRLIPGVDSLVMLPHWETSEGAKIEKERAENRGLKIWYWPEDKDKIQKNV